MKNKLTFLIAPAIFCCWCFFSIQGCKEPLIQDKDLLAGSDTLNLAKDTLRFKSTAVIESPLISNGIAVGVLGSISDPNFGKMYASFYAQIQLTNSAISFGDHPVLDSAVLTLQYNGVYGKFTTPVNVAVYNLNQNLVDSSTYYTNSAFQVKTPPIGQLSNFVPNLNDTVFVMGTGLTPHMRIRLSDAYGDSLLLGDSNTLRDNAAFLNKFKGLYITTSSTTPGNGIVYLNLPSYISGVTLYYHNDLGDSLNYAIPITGVTVNHFDNNYNGTPVYTAAHSTNPNGETKLFVSGGAGVKGKLEIIKFDSIPKHIGVNKAELILTQSQVAGDTNFAAPILLNLYRIDDAGYPARVDDDGLVAFGGVAETDVVNGVSVVRYRFNIKRYFQKLLQGIYTNKGFYVQAQYANYNAERLVITNSPTDKNNQISLILTYTKL